MIAGVLALAVTAATPAAQADVYGDSSVQHTSLWTYYSEDVCVGLGQDTRVTTYPTQTWYSKVTSANNGGELSWSASIAGYIGISYTPPAQCQRAHVLGPFTLVAHGEILKAVNGQWTVCQMNSGSQYGSFWATTGGFNWGFGIYGNGGTSAGCGPGWYFSEGAGLAWQNGTWNGHQPTQTPAGPSGPIWMS